MDYALYVALALYGVYSLGVARKAPKDRRLYHVIGALVVAAVFYGLLRAVFIAYGIQSR
jgi:hypothetical protein